MAKKIFYWLCVPLLFFALAFTIIRLFIYGIIEEGKLDIKNIMPEKKYYVYEVLNQKEEVKSNWVPGHWEVEKIDEARFILAFKNKRDYDNYMKDKALAEEYNRKYKLAETEEEKDRWLSLSTSKEISITSYYRIDSRIDVGTNYHLLNYFTNGSIIYEHELEDK